VQYLQRRESEKTGEVSEVSSFPLIACCLSCTSNFRVGRASGGEPRAFRFSESACMTTIPKGVRLNAVPEALTARSAVNIALDRTFRIRRVTSITVTWLTVSFLFGLQIALAVNMTVAEAVKDAVGLGDGSELTKLQLGAERLQNTEGIE